MKNGTKTFVVCDFNGNLELYADDRDLREYNDLDSDYDVSDYVSVVTINIAKKLDADLEVFTSEKAAQKLAK